MELASQAYYYPVNQKVVESNKDWATTARNLVSNGPFKITDLTSTSSGNLTLEVIENGGEKKIFIIPMQNSFNLLRPEQYNYSLALGNYKTIDKIK